MAIAAVVAASFALFICTSSFSWFHDPTAAQHRIAAVQDKVITTRPDARTIIMGNSRAAFGIEPAVIEERLGYPPLSVANWAYPSFDRWSFEHLIAANPDKIRKATAVVTVVDEIFLLGDKPPVYESTTRNWAAVIDTELRGNVSSVLPVADRAAWFFREVRARAGISQRFSLNWPMSPRGHWESEGTHVLSDRNATAESRTIAGSYFRNKEINRKDVALWRRYLAQLAQLNPRAALMYLPASPSFVLAEKQYADVVAQNRSAFRELAKEAGLPLVELSAEDCGLTDSAFADPVHVNDAGRPKLSECFARHLGEVRHLEHGAKNL